MWSRSSIPISLPALNNRFVVLMSSFETDTSPDGWKCKVVITDSTEDDWNDDLDDDSENADDGYMDDEVDAAA